MNHTKTVYIIHGYCAETHCHWFPWLKEQLLFDNVDVQILKMPRPTHPKKEEWLKALYNQIHKLDENTYLIGHSLGCITILNYLDSITGLPHIGGMILVSGFNHELKEIPSINHFINPNLDYQKIIHSVRKRVVVTAKNDQIVPTSMSLELAQSLDAKVYQLPKGNHFMDDDGFTTFPYLYDIIKQMIND